MCAKGSLAAGWWYKPDFIINDININSAVTSPAHDEVITLAEGNSHVSIAGYAYSGAEVCPPATEHTPPCQSLVSMHACLLNNLTV